jgi:hypothetical protein
MIALGRTLVGFPSRSVPGVGDKPRPAAWKKSLPTVEELDKLLLLSVGCPVISGFVYLDQNSNAALTNNGHLDPGEVPIGGAKVLLLDANKNLVASTTTDVNGAYSFASVPNANTAPVTTAPQTITLGPKPTPFTNAPFTPSSIGLFDSSLGTLTSVSITHSASLNSSLVAENPAPVPISITAVLNGNYQINGLLQPITGSGSTTTGPVLVPPLDPQNPSANDLPVNLAITDGPSTLKLTSASDLQFFTASAGRTAISPTVTATADTTVSGAGVQVSNVTRAQAAALTVTYTYIPKVCIPNGQYTLVQIPNPPQLINGKTSQPNVVFPAPPVGQPQMLQVTVNEVDLPDNDFAKLTAGTPGNGNLSCPTPGTLVRYGVHHQQTQLVLSFVGPVNPTLVNNPANYFVTTANGRQIRVVSATFDPATNSVTLIPAKNLNVHFRYDLSVALPCNGPCNNVVIPFGGRKSLGGFQNHRGQFVPVVNGEIIRPGHGVRPHALAHAHALRGPG